MTLTATRTITIPELAVVALVGASGSGKSTFARTHFKASEVLSSDGCRALVSDDENAQDATNDAFDVLYYIAAKRLARGNLVVIDATNLKPQDRRAIVQLARDHHVIPCAIALDISERVCRDRNADRADRDFDSHVIPRQAELLRKSLKSLKREGFRSVTVLKGPDEVAAITIERQPLWNNKKTVTGPFDIIGDIHGCFDELVDLLTKLGWSVDPERHTATPPDDRMALLVGDYVDRGPRTPDVLRLLMNMVDAGVALCVPGNHDQKLVRKLNGRDVRLTHGLPERFPTFPRDERTPLPDQTQQVVRGSDLVAGRSCEAARGQVSHPIGAHRTSLKTQGGGCGNTEECPGARQEGT